MGRLLELFQASRQSNQEADALIAALRPFLREERRKSWTKPSNWPGCLGQPGRPTAYGKRVSSIYNAYIPGGGPYEKIPEEHPPGFESMFSSLLGSKGTGGLSGLLGKLGLGKLDSGDILLLLILFLLWREGDHFDLVLLLALAFLFLRDSDT